MKTKKLIGVTLSLLINILTISGCAFQFEVPQPGNGFSSSESQKAPEEYLVRFEHNGIEVYSSYVTKDSSVEMPRIEEYIPEENKFLGWTPLEENKLSFGDAYKFHREYFPLGNIFVTYDDLSEITRKESVTLRPLILPKKDIPKADYFAVIAWYNKTGTSGLDRSKVDSFENETKKNMKQNNYLDNEINKLCFRSYTGNVGPTTNEIVEDGDVDIMLGWGSASNISSTGNIPPDQVYESIEIKISDGNGGIKNRCLHRISNDENAIAVFNLIVNSDLLHFFENQ